MWRLENNDIIETKVNLLKKNKNKNLNFFEIMEYANDNNREIYIDAITPIVADKLNKTIRFWNDIDDGMGYSMAERQPIKIFIDSFGGSLTAAFTMIDSIKLSRTPVYTYNIGTTYKESFFVYLAGHKKFAYPRSSFCYEKPQSQGPGVSIGFAQEEQNQSNYQDFFEKQLLELKSMLMEGTKVTEADEKRQSWWFNAEKAYELKLCNEVIRGRLN